MLRWGILSTASIAREQLVPAIAASDNGTLAAVASRDPARAEAMATRYGIPRAHGSYEALLADPDIDAVYVPVPNDQHVSWAVKAAEAGKHVLVEKPLGLTASAIEPLIAARDRTGVTVAEGFMVTHHPQWRRVRALLAEGAVGRLVRVQATFSFHNDDPDNTRNNTDQGGGALYDIGVYPTVATRYATGREPARVLCEIERDPRFGVDRTASVWAAFEGGEGGAGAEPFRLEFYVSTQLALEQRIAFHGPDGIIALDAPFNADVFATPTVTLWRRGRDEASVWRFPDAQQYRRQVEGFARTVAGEARAGEEGGEERDEIFALEDSVRNQRVIDACFRSGESGAWETV